MGRQERETRLWLLPGPARLHGTFCQRGVPRQHTVTVRLTWACAHKDRMKYPTPLVKLWLNLFFESFLRLFLKNEILKNEISMTVVKKARVLGVEGEEE